MKTAIKIKYINKQHYIIKKFLNNISTIKMDPVIGSYINNIFWDLL